MNSRIAPDAVFRYCGASLRLTSQIAPGAVFRYVARRHSKMGGPMESVGVMSVLAVVALVCFFLAWVLGRVIRRLEKLEKQAFTGIPGFVPTIEQYFVTARSGITGLAFDETNRKIGIKSGKEKPYIFSFDEVRDAELQLNDVNIQSTSLGSQVARGAAGALINPLFAVVGMLTAKKKSEQFVTKLALKISVANLQKPVHTIVFYDGKKIAASQFEKLPLAKDADTWAGRILYLASMNKG
jgi:hypothetical protein